MCSDHKKTIKKIRIKLYNTLALPALLYGSENWIIKARDARRITAAEMKYMKTAGYSWTDYKINLHIAKELEITPVLDKVLDTTCKQNVSRQTTQDNETLFPNWQKESWQTSEETSRYVRPERVNKWPNSMTDI